LTESTPQFSYILFDVIGEKKYAKITINRPEVMNALNVDVRKELLGALDRVEKDPDVRAVVITGAGEKAFSAGADIKMFQTMTAIGAKAYLEISKGASKRIETFPKPVIAAVNGYAIGGGLELAMSCDLIIASDNARFAQSEINVGIIPGVGGTQRLPRIVGLKVAKEMIYTGDLIDSERARKIGLVNAVVPRDQLIPAVEKIVEKIASKSPLILKLAKDALNSSWSGLDKGLDYESALFATCFASKDQKEGASAFLEKRQALFTGE
jgi:enoyl-CoA hydratase